MAEKSPSIFSRPPEFLYKYRSFQGDKDKKRVMEIITDSKIYLSKPTAFNDPFDCKADKCYYDPKDEEEARKMLEGALIRKFPDKSRQVCRQMAKKPNHETWFLTEEIQRQSINNSGIFSLAEENNNILLWSHYADGHKGLCLGFAIKKQIKSLLFNITYQSERPHNGALKGHLVQFKDILCTKSKDWAYEKEWRIIYTPSHDGAVVGYGKKPFPKESLVGIIFGCEMPDDDKNEIVDLVKDRPTLKLQQAEMTPGKFALTIKPYEH